MEVRGQLDKEMNVSTSRIALDSSQLPKPNRLSSHQTLDSFRSREPDRVSTVGSDHLETTAAPLAPPQMSEPPTTSAPSVRYRECQKNHAASMGGHVVDGCGEFMPRGEDGTPEALKCAACDCHRNFHRKEVDGQSQSHYPAAAHLNYNFTPARKNSNRRDAITITPPPPGPSSAPPGNYHRHRTVPRAAPVMMAFGAPAESSSEDLNNMVQQANGLGGQAGSASRKRFRTKFSAEQKEKMMEFAEKLGWRIQKQDEQKVQRFCDELALKRQVFKVWMHNNKPTSNNNRNP